MPIHIGRLIQEQAEARKFSQQELGQRINRSKQNVGDIYKRQSIDSELLLRLSEVLEYDLFSIYYAEEPLQGMRKKEIEEVTTQVSLLKGTLQQKEEIISNLKIALEASQKTITLLEEERAEHKKILKTLQKKS
jgi:transcriptional regulator with XRE-family HTH domain